jgi:hypothetical protein
MGDILGIDIGACYLKAVLLRERDGAFVPILNRDHTALFRVCAQKVDSGAIVPLTRDEDRNRALERGGHVIENVKVLRGEGKGGEQVEVAVLTEMLECYRNITGDSTLGSIARVVLAHPVSPRPAAVAALKKIAVEAGISAGKIDTIEEPVALGLFATRSRLKYVGRLLVIDTGHYSSDIVVLSFKQDNSVVPAQYLGIRLGAAELIHEVARSLWVKIQIAGGVPQVEYEPFIEHGPENTNLLVRQLSAWVEERVIRSRELGLFSEDSMAFLETKRITGLPAEAWTKLVHSIRYFFDLSGAQNERLEVAYPHHDRQLSKLAQRQNYSDVAKPILQALCASVASVAFELDDLTGMEVVLGGGTSFIPEVRNHIEEALVANRFPAPINADYRYEGLSGTTMGQLLAVAAGAAMAATKTAARQDTLSDAIGVILWYELGEALELLDNHHQLPPDFNPSSAEDLSRIGAQTFPVTGVVAVPIHRAIAARGIPLPAKIAFSDYLSSSSEGGTIVLTRFGDDAGVGTLPRDYDISGQIVARVKLPASRITGEALRLFLDVRRNDVWEIRVTGPSGNEPILKTEITLDLLGRSDS